MNSFLNSVTAKRYLMIMNFSVLAVHTSLVFLFSVLRVTLMVYFNVCSILCYCMCFALVRQERVSEYISVTFVEILFHSFLAVLSVGCGPGFQLYFIDGIAIVLFAQYFSAHIGVKPVNGPVLSTACGAMYILSLILDRVHAPLYLLNEDIAFSCMTLNSVLTVVFIVVFFSLLTSVAVNSETELVRLASHDNLTGLMNRHYMMKYMNNLHQTEDLENYWIAILDIDDFIMINDRYGHLCGDFVLRSVSKTIKACCGDRMVCRWGGEEFLVVGVDSDAERGLNALLEKIRGTIAEEEFIYDDGVKLHLTVTIGAAYYRGDRTLDDWVNEADVRLYNGKQTGKNRVISADA